MKDGLAGYAGRNLSGKSEGFLFSGQIPPRHGKNPTIRAVFDLTLRKGNAVFRQKFIQTGP